MAILDNFVFNALHEIDELLERDCAVRVGVNVFNEFTHLIWVSLEGAHNCFEVFNTDTVFFFFIEKVKDFTQVLYLVFSKLL